MEQRPECPMEHVRPAGGVFPFGRPTLEIGAVIASGSDAIQLEIGERLAGWAWERRGDHQLDRVASSR